MAVKVLVVDDSSFFRRRVSEIINQDPMLTVIDTAQNGREAVDKAMSLRPDVITMDIEMPVMDGISAVREIMAKCPTPILMFSSLTHEGAKATLDALDAGALDFLPKKFEDIARDKDEAVKLLQQRVREIARKRFLMAAARPRAPEPLVRPALGAALTRPLDRQPEPVRAAIRKEALDDAFCHGLHKHAIEGIRAFAADQGIGACAADEAVIARAASRCSAAAVVSPDTPAFTTRAGMPLALSAASRRGG